MMLHVHIFNLCGADVFFVWSYDKKTNIQIMRAQTMENLTRNGCEHNLNGPRDVVYRCDVRGKY